MAMPPLDLIIRNATVLTMDDRRPEAGAIGVQNGRIVAVGAELDGYSATRQIDGGGLTVLPGFNDVHCHTTWFGLSLTEVDCAAFGRLDDVYAALAAKIAVTPEGSWVLASGFNHQAFGGQYPDIAILDRLAPRHPIYIRHNSGHACIVNSAALELAGFLAADRVEEDGALAVRDRGGCFTGLLEERAQQKIQDLFLPHSQRTITEAIDRATSVYAAEGITSFTEAGIGGGWIGHSPLELAAYQTALDNGALSARAQLMVALDALHPVVGHVDDPIKLGLDLGVRTGFGNELLRVGPTKVFLDGSLLGLTAAMNDPYCVGAAHNHGYFQGDVGQLKERILAAYRSGWSIAAHAIGDSAIDLAIEIFEKARSLYGNRPVPNRIEHGGVITDAQLARIQAVGAIVVPQPGFIPAFGVDMARALGADRVPLSYRAASLLSAGIPLPGSSDRPVTSGNALRNVQAFVERLDAAGEIYGPDERITVAEALRAYTLGSAQTTGADNVAGSITPGKFADFVLLDRNPLTTPVESIAQIGVAATIMNGEFTYDHR
ncbi:amidohydrolase [Cryobacterium sp. PH29-G1]|uniref:amidohydrolase n=1 Tax=Cryobacterium sp. PH29-G1 TaxID=3046211 RepID=UPI0024BAADA3|nr:amidohydrolase [Cryobacterium sp. PH29-G1]MDJ0349660.1 amidohydrolase [Cryobacterium sp. PH29-G1]